MPRGHLVGRTPAHRQAHLARFVLHIGTRNDVLHGLIERRNDAPGVAAGTEMPFQLVTS